MFAPFSAASGRWTGYQIENYIIGPFLGSGGYGEVYQAYEKKHPHRRVAIKILRLEGRSKAEIEEARHRFMIEAEIGTKYQLPHVIRILHNPPIVWRGRLCQVMQYMPGGSLADWIRHFNTHKEPWIDIATAIRIGREIALGLHAMHRAGWIHRDVKPSNVLFNHKRQAIISDLGLVQLVGSLYERRRAGSLATPIGDPLYRPPEQAAGQPSTEASDVYMWGVTLFELLTLQKYYYHKGSHAREFRPDMPTWLDALIAKAVQEAPEKRFQSMAEVLSALQSPRPFTRPGIQPPYAGRTKFHVSARIWSMIRRVLLALIPFLIGGGIALWSVVKQNMPNVSVIEQNEPTPQIVADAPDLTSTLIPSPSHTPAPSVIKIITAPPPPTPTPIILVVTPTSSPTPTLPYGYEKVCAEAPPSPFAVGREGYVCYSSKVLLYRKASRKSVIGSMDPGLPFSVIGGPECGAQRVWWQVRIYTPYGYTLTGWMPETSEGGVERYLCPGRKNSE